MDSHLQRNTFFEFEQYMVRGLHLLHHNMDHGLLSNLQQFGDQLGLRVNKGLWVLQALLQDLLVQPVMRVLRVL